MFESVKASFLKSGVVILLTNTGLDKEIARTIAHSSPKSFFMIMKDPLKNVNGQQKNIIATIAVLNGFTPPNAEVDLMLDEIRQQVMAAFLHQLKVSDYRVVGRTLNTVMHLLFEEELMNSAEIEKEYCPANWSDSCLNY